MNPDNPYAAPQTALRHSPESLPVAEDRSGEFSRRFFPEWDSAHLNRLIGQSRPIENMQLVWLLLWFAVVGSSVVFYLRSSVGNPALTPANLRFWLLIGLMTFRFVGGFIRSKLGRWFMLAMDGLLFVACLIWFGVILVVIWPDLGFLFGLLMIAVPCFLLCGIMYFAWRSCYALVKFQELFQPDCVQHDELVHELEYRQAHGID